MGHADVSTTMNIYAEVNNEVTRESIENLAKNYYAYGLTTPEAMNPKYAASTSWANKVKNYINYIKES